MCFVVGIASFALCEHFCRFEAFCSKTNAGLFFQHFFFYFFDVLTYVINSFRTFHGGGYGGYQSTPNIPQGVASMDVDLPGAPNKKKAKPLIGYERVY